MGERTNKQTHTHTKNNQTRHQTLKPIKHTNRKTHKQPTEQSNAQERQNTHDQTNKQRCRAGVAPNLVRPKGPQPGQAQKASHLVDAICTSHNMKTDVVLHCLSTNFHLVVPIGRHPGQVTSHNLHRSPKCTNPGGHLRKHTHTAYRT